MKDREELTEKSLVKVKTKKEKQEKESKMAVLGTERATIIIEKIIKDSKVGVDYAVLSEGLKPTMLVPMADKLCMSFGLVPKWRKDIDSLSMLEGVKNCVAYVCELYYRDGTNDKLVGEGRGAAVLGESKNCKTINSTIKMAEIRSKRDSVLNTFALRDRFTQDMEEEAGKLTEIIEIDNKDGNVSIL